MPGVLEGGAIRLCRRCLTDVPPFMDALRASWPELRAWFPWAQRDLDEAEQTQRALDADKAFSEGSDFEFVLVEAESEAVVGSLRLNPSCSPNTAEIGYWVRSDRTNCGYATMAAHAVTRAAFEHLKSIERVVIQMDVANGASAAVARKSGFRLDREDELAIEAPARTGRGYVWVMTRDVWLAMRQD